MISMWILELWPKTNFWSHSDIDLWTLSTKSHQFFKSKWRFVVKEKTSLLYFLFLIPLSGYSSGVHM